MDAQLAVMNNHIKTDWTMFDMHQHITKFHPGIQVTINDKIANIQYTMPNGWVVSVGVDPFHYCDNRAYMDEKITADDNRERTTLDWARLTTNAEIAVWHNSNHEMLTFPDGDTVQGWVSSQTILQFIEQVLKGE